jgi:hypothetical protein
MWRHRPQGDALMATHIAEGLLDCRSRYGNVIRHLNRMNRRQLRVHPTVTYDEASKTYTISGMKDHEAARLEQLLQDDPMLLGLAHQITVARHPRLRRIDGYLKGREEGQS